jgi:hypothetical protein
VLCCAAADASAVQGTTEPSPVADTQEQQQGHPKGQDLLSSHHHQQQAPQQQQQAPQQQQQQEGLLGPITEQGHALEVDQVVERELLDSNGESLYSLLKWWSCGAAG